MTPLALLSAHELQKLKKYYEELKEVPPNPTDFPDNQAGCAARMAELAATFPHDFFLYGLELPH